MEKSVHVLKVQWMKYVALVDKSVMILAQSTARCVLSPFHYARAKYQSTPSLHLVVGKPRGGISAYN